MKKLIVKIMILTSLFGIFGFQRFTDPSKWSSEQLNKWFEKGEWLNGWNVTPDATINKKEFAVAYFKNKERWDKAFTFLNSNDLSKLEIRRHDIDGDNLYATVSDYTTKNEEGARYEAHQKYIDIQYVISGVENIGFAPMSMKKDVITPFNAERDIEFLTVSKQNNLKATPDKFFIFFPSDAHCPGLKAGENSHVRKIVVKVRID
jgi:YhcH/YjgK/YiaL family protein